MQGGEHGHLHEDQAVTSGVPWNPFAMKTMHLSAEPSTWGSSAEKEGSPEPKPASVGRREQWAEGDARAGL